MTRIASCVLLAALLAAAQEPIRVSTRLIETTVVVRDSHGPVRDLAAVDFQISDDGKPQKIAVFRVSQSTVKRETASALPPNVFSNRVARSSPAENRTLLLIDTRNTDPPDQVYARTQTIAMLEKNEIDHPVGIYIFGDKASLLHDFTMDKQALIDSLKKLWPEQSQKLRMATVPTPPFPGGGKSAELAAESFAEMREHGNRDRSWNTVDAFAELERFLNRVPGRKTILWITDSFPGWFLRGEQQRIERLNSGDVAIYSVHLRGLIVSLGFKHRVADPETDSMNWIADQTGGKAYYGRNDVGQAMHEAIEDSGVYYTIGFYAQRDKPDNEFHRLTVSVDRKGTEVSHRQGYFDSARS